MVGVHVLPDFFKQTIEFHDGKKSKSDDSAIAEEDNESDSGILECVVRANQEKPEQKCDFVFPIQNLTEVES
jgi:hypothetical protein